MKKICPARIERILHPQQYHKKISKADIPEKALSWSKIQIQKAYADHNVPDPDGTADIRSVRNNNICYIQIKIKKGRYNEMKKRIWMDRKTTEDG